MCRLHTGDAEHAKGRAALTLAANSKISTKLCSSSKAPCCSKQRCQPSSVRHVKRQLLQTHRITQSVAVQIFQEKFASPALQYGRDEGAPGFQSHVAPVCESLQSMCIWCKLLMQLQSLRSSAQLGRPWNIVHPQSSSAAESLTGSCNRTDTSMSLPRPRTDHLYPVLWDTNL